MDKTQSPKEISQSLEFKLKSAWLTKYLVLLRATKIKWNTKAVTATIGLLVILDISDRKSFSFCKSSTVNVYTSFFWQWWGGIESQSFREGQVIHAHKSQTNISLTCKIEQYARWRDLWTDSCKKVTYHHFSRRVSRLRMGACDKSIRPTCVWRVYLQKEIHWVLHTASKMIVIVD